MNNIDKTATSRSGIFDIHATDAQTRARCGRITTPHGTIETPVFMPVGTNATVKAIQQEALVDIDTEIILANTYHLFIRPGLEVIKRAGGVHTFMRWERPILTDSGGYQVFSLARLRTIKDEGVQFNSHLDGAPHFFTPEDIVTIQGVLGSDIMMVLDECVGYPTDRKSATVALQRTTVWAKRSWQFFSRRRAEGNQQLLFGIVQGATYEDLRRRSAQEIVGIGFDGYAIGGVSVGEPVNFIHDTVEQVEPLLPKESPRYLMGIGMPDQIVTAVGQGIDMFDTCVPTRYGRYGTAFTSTGKVIVRNGAYTLDQAPLDQRCDCFVCRRYSRSYLRHLFNAHEMLGPQLVSYHNVYFYLQVMRQMRQAIRDNRFADFQKEFLSCYNSTS